MEMDEIFFMINQILPNCLIIIITNWKVKKSSIFDISFLTAVAVASMESNVNLLATFKMF